MKFLRRSLQPITHHLQLNKGFSLIEFLVVATLLIVISSIALIGYSSTSKSARDKQREKDLKTLQVAMEQYYETYKSYPNASTMDDLLNDEQFTEFLQNSEVKDPVNSGVYEYTVTSNTSSYQLSYTREADQVQVIINNLGS